MADENQPIGLDKPAGTPAPPNEETEIHVIPEEFYGASAKHRPAPPRAEQADPSAEGVDSSGGDKPSQPEKQKGKAGLIIAIAAVILLICGGVAVYFLLFASKGPVCGDATCNAPAENYQNCPTDCEPPPPECGDGICENPENHISCPEDCEPEGPECGDGACDAEESFESCPRDCEPPEPVCGDGKCEMNRGETYNDCPEDCEPPPPEQANDMDSDGLTDAEETEIFGSDPNSVNSDGDSFVDLNEVLNLFDPSQPDPARLIDSPGITVYRNEDFGIQLLRPISWGVRDIPVERTVRFTSPTGESVQVTLYTKDENTSLVDWLPDAPIEGMSAISSFESLVNKLGYEQIITSDRRTILLSNGATVVSLTYDLADELKIRYRVTLSMVANSLEFIGGGAPVPVTSEPAEVDPTALPPSSEGGSTEEEG